jgi:membrane fusion protein, peptide pheromone/bacteriocin exporter
LEFYNRLLDAYAKKKEYIVGEAALKAQNYTDDQIKQYKDQQNIKMNELYYDTIVGFTNEKAQFQSEKSKLEAQKAMYERSLNAYKITAPKSGKIHLATPITKGMVLHAGNLLGSISDSKDGLIIEMNLSSSERPMIHT